MNIYEIVKYIKKQKENSTATECSYKFVYIIVTNLILPAIASTLQLFKINETESEKVKTFTDREISREFPNMTFNILIDSSNGFRRVKLTTKMEINEEKSLTDDSDYIINWNRRPIGHLRKGKLPEILNTLFAQV